MRLPKNLNRIVLTAAIAGAIAAGADSVAAATWNIAGSGSWNTAGNWSGGVPNGIDQVAGFTNNITSTAVITLNVNATVGQINFGDSNNTHAYQITPSGGNALTFDVTAGNATIVKTNAAQTRTDTISANIALADNLVITNDATATGGRIVLSGVISGAGASVQKLGVGRIEMSGQSTFSGGVEITEGTITVNEVSSNFGGGTGPLGIGTLTLNGGRIIGSSVNSTVSTLENAIELEVPAVGTNTITNNGALTLSGIISGAGGFTKSGNGPVFLANSANSYSGVTTISGAAVVAAVNAPSGANGALGNSTSAVQIDPSGADVSSLLTGGAISIDRPVNITATGTGTVGIGGVANATSSFTGLVTFHRGMTIGQVTTGGTLNIAGGLNGANTTPATLTFGQAAIATPPASPELFGDVNVNSAISESGGGAVSVAVLGGTVTYATGNTNSYSGTTTVSAGKLVVNGTHTGAGAYVVAAAATLAGNGSIVSAANAGVAVSGLLSPGASAGVLSMDLGSGALDISAAVNVVNSQSMLFELDTPGASDQVLLPNAASSLNIGTGTLEFDDFAFTALSGFGPGTYTLFDTGNVITGTLGANLSGTINSLDASIGLANGGQDVVLNVVPEPMGFVLSGIGVLALLIGAVRNQRAPALSANNQPEKK